MVKNFWHQVNTIINEADLILIVLDARIPFLTNNPEIENKIIKKEKNIIYVINKCDLVNMEDINKIKKEFSKSVFVSTKEHYGSTILKKKIMAFTTKKEKEQNSRLKELYDQNPNLEINEHGEQVEVEFQNKKLSKRNSLTVGLIGYPNTGKSSIINMLTGRSSARTSSHSGQTKGSQKVRLTSRVLMIDSPGVFPFKGKDDIRRVILGSINPNGLKDVDLYAYELIKFLNKEIQEFYFKEFNPKLDEEKILEQIAEKMKFRMKGNKLDINKASCKVIIDWQKGKIKTLKVIKNFDELN